MLTGRLKAAFEERALDATMGLQALTTEPEGSHRVGADRSNHGVSLPFRAIDRPVMFQVDVAAEPTGTSDEVITGTGVLALRSDSTN